MSKQKVNKRKELGEFLQRIIRQEIKVVDGKVIVLKQTGQEEGDNTQGGYLVEQAIIPTILAPDFSEGKLYADCKIFNVGEKSNGSRIPVAAETTRNTSGIKGGVLAYWKEEGQTKLPSIAKFDQLKLTLNKAAAVIYVTDELKQDSEMLGGYISESVGEAIMWLVDRAIIYGGGGSMNGIAAAACTGFAATTDPITVTELKDALDLYYGSPNGKWYLSHEVWSQIGDLYDTMGTTAIPLTFDADGGAHLWGLPVIVSDVFNDNDFMLGDLSQYVIIQKELVSTVSMDLLFLEDESTFRFVLRINGDALWRNAITLQDLSVVHPFVMRTGAEESSSSTNSSESSSSQSSESSSSNSSSSSKDSSSSSSSVGNSSSSSSSSDSSESSSSESSSSSSSSQSSSSSSSQSSSSSSTESSSSSSLDECCKVYLGEGFSTEALNGDWVFSGTYNAKPYYINQDVDEYMWYDTATGYWAISDDLGDPQISWLSTTDTAVACPGGDAWVSESGTMTCTEGSSSSSSSSDSSQSQQ